MNPEPDTMATRPSLLFRLRDWDDAASWDEFYWLYSKMIYRIARRSGLGHPEAEEVTQDVFTRVAKTIHEYESQPQKGSFRRWLLNLAHWRIADKFREAQRKSLPLLGQNPEEEDRTRGIERIPDERALGSMWEDEWRTHLLQAALSRVARRTKAQHFQAFELCTQQNWPIGRVARELKINPAAVYLIRHRLTKLLRAEIAKLETVLN